MDNHFKQEDPRSLIIKDDIKYKAPYSSIKVQDRGLAPTYLEGDIEGTPLRPLHTVGAGMNAKTNEGTIPLHVVQYSLTLDSIVEHRNVDSNIQGKDGDTPLHCCAARREEGVDPEEYYAQLVGNKASSTYDIE